MRINALSLTFEKKLQLHGIPYVVWGGFKFYDRAEIKTALDYLRVVANPNDEVALFNIINLPRRGIGDTTIEKIKELATEKGTTCYDIIKDIDTADIKISANTKNAIKQFAGVISALAVAGGKGLSVLAKELPVRTGLADFYANDRERGDDKVANIDQLCKTINDFAISSPNADLGGFLQTVSISGNEDPDAVDKVILSTIHSAKGLEFNTVFIVGVEDGIFPSRAKDSDELEEERRLLYVAVTRAKRNLYISYSSSRFIYGSRRPQDKSQFLYEIDFDGEDENYGWQF
jgi:DNA helicase-2/ATP-dependent DNA helicase PcrA